MHLELAPAFQVRQHEAIFPTRVKFSLISSHKESLYTCQGYDASGIQD